MELVDLKQKWKGYFTYLKGYETIDQYIEVEFLMDIIVNNDSFIGLSIDSESKDAFDKKPANVKGFFEKDSVSFIMKYPCLYYKNEKGQIIIDERSEHPDIHYFGYFDTNKREVNGNWEMTLAQEEYLDGYLEETINGSFQMRRVS